MPIFAIAIKKPNKTTRLLGFFVKINEEFCFAEFPFNLNAP
jgi:hypothetical protein